MSVEKNRSAPKRQRVLWNWYRLADGFGQVVFNHFGDRVAILVSGRHWKSPVRAGDLPAWYVDCLSDEELREYAMGLIKRLVDDKNGEFRGLPASDPGLAKSCPTLVSYLCDQAYDDGEVRRTSSILVFTEDGTWKACLTDRDVDLNLWAEARTLQGLLQALEKRLSEAQPGWRRPTRRKAR